MGGIYATSDVTRDVARNIFLYVLAKKAPEILIKLSDEVMPLYAQVSYVQKWSQVEPYTDGDTELGRLHLALEEWAKPYLNYGWVYDAALNTLRHAHRENPSWKDNPTYWLTFGYGENFLPSTRGFPVSLNEEIALTPDPSQRTRDGFVERVKKVYKENIGKRVPLRVQKAAMQAYDRSQIVYIKSPDDYKVQDSRPKLLLHAEWLVRYLIKDEKHKDIRGSGNFEINYEKEGKAIRDFAKLIGVELPNKQGKRGKRHILPCN